MSEQVPGGTSEIKKPRTLTPERAKQLAAERPDFEKRMDDLCEEVGLGRKFK